MDLIEAKRLAAILMDQHLGSVENFPKATWRFKFDRAVRRFGYCSYTKRTISLSAPLTLLNSEADVKETLLHEIAHALAYTRYGARGHGATWRAVARSIGATGERCYAADHQPESADAYTGPAFAQNVKQPPAPYIGTCPNGHTIKRYRKTAKMFRGSCSKCSPTFDSRFMFTWRKVN